MGTTFLTGASSGLGRSLALRLAADGEALAVVARRAELLDSLVLEIERAGGRALALACDVTDLGAVQDAVRRAEERLGPITRLVANAGGAEPTPVDGFTAAHVAAQLELNVLGVANCIEVVLPGMLARGAGHLVATSSLAGYRGLPASAAYSAAKGALTNLMEGLRVDLRPRGIDVTVLAPGFFQKRPGKDRRKRNRPLRMDLETASERAYRAIRARRAFYAFPKPLVALVWLARLLPAPIFDRVVAGRGPKLS
jgi:short-subunit dehydrogenase